MFELQPFPTPIWLLHVYFWFCKLTKGPISIPGYIGVIALIAPNLRHYSPEGRARDREEFDGGTSSAVTCGLGRGEAWWDSWQQRWTPWSVSQCLTGGQGSHSRSCHEPGLVRGCMHTSARKNFDQLQLCIQLQMNNLVINDFNISV